MANNRQEVEPEQGNLSFEEARGLPNPEINLGSLPVGQSVTRNSTGTIPKTINRSTGRGRGFMRRSIEAIYNRDRTTNENRSIVENNPNQSLLWDGINLPVPEISKSTNHQPDGNEKFQIDSFLEDNN